ncbi:MAG: tetratricopeptide repeat protein [Chloroflexota bacterium]|nr:tetratricopeptide repeat protein [Chloroflexota bacterium]
MRKTLFALWLLIAAALLPTSCSPSPTTLNRRGNDAYARGNYDEALRQYQNAQSEAPDTPELHYNAGNTLYRQEQYDPASDESLAAIAQAPPELQAQTYYNLGNARFQQEDYAGAIAAYVEALRINPDDADAKHNLELAQQRLREQQQQQPTPTPSPESQEGEQTPTPQPQDQQQQATPTPQPGQGQNQQTTPTPGAQPQPAEGELTEEQARQLLQALMQDAETLQEVLQRMRPAPGRPVDKDW